MEEQNAETVSKLIRMQSLASELNMQLVQASGDVEKLRQERDEILDKLAAQEKLLRDILSVSSFYRFKLCEKIKLFVLLEISPISALDFETNLNCYSADSHRGPGTNCR